MDCIIIDDDKITCTILESFIEKTNGLKLIKTFYNPVEALQAHELFHAGTLMFLDMEMPEMHGLDFLKSHIHTPHVIFISGSKNYALDAFNFNARDFLLKPITYPRFLQAIQKVRQIYQEDKSQVDTVTNHAFFFKKKHVFYKVVPKDIIWIESNDNYTNVITKDTSFMVNNTLKSFESILVDKNFIRTHRRYIINLEYLWQIEDNHIFMRLQQKTTAIPLSKTYKDALLKTAISFK